MSELSQRFNAIISDIEKNLKNKEDVEYVKAQITNVAVLFMDTIDVLTQINEQKIQKIEQKQEELDKKLSKVDTIVNGIEKDIYEEDDNSYDFEIVCPYCNHEFVADIDSTGKDEVQCPECKNIIELDWNMEEEACTGDCSCCHGECEEEDFSYDDEEENSDQELDSQQTKQQEEKDSSEENDEDM